MPRRREVTDHAAEVDRLREQSNRRVRRFRARSTAAEEARNVTRRNGNVTVPQLLLQEHPMNGQVNGAHRNVTPLSPQTPLSPASPSDSPPTAPEPLTLTRIERLQARLAPYVARGYKADPAFLERLATTYPELDLELEIAAALDWLEQPAHVTRACSKAFLANWCKRAHTEANTRPPTTLGKGLLLPNGTYVPPAALQRNPGPEGLPQLSGPLERVAPEDLQRALGTRAGVPLAKKLAQATQVKATPARGGQA